MFTTAIFNSLFSAQKKYAQRDQKENVLPEIIRKKEMLLWPYFRSKYLKSILRKLSFIVLIELFLSVGQKLFKFKKNLIFNGKN